MKAGDPGHLPGESLQKANQARQRKQEIREKLKTEYPDLFQMVNLVRNHSRLIKQMTRSAKRIEKFIREKFEVDENVL